MGNFLDNVAARSLNLLPVVRPRLASRFEPLSPVGGLSVAPAFAAETNESAQRPPHVADQSLAQTTNARTLEMRPMQPNAPQVADGSRQQESRTVDRIERAPMPDLQAQRTHTPMQPIKIERAQAQPPTTTTGAAETQASAAHDKQQVDQATRTAVEREKQATLDSTIRRIVAGQLDARRERLMPPVLPLREPPPMSRAEAREPAERAPTVHITIGRIEVRAITSPNTEQHRAPARPRPMLSLEDYLQQRNGGRR